MRHASETLLLAQVIWEERRSVLRRITPILVDMVVVWLVVMGLAAVIYFLLQSVAPTS